MIIEKIKDEAVRKRIERFKITFPRNMSHDNNPLKSNPSVSKFIEEFVKNDSIMCLPKEKVIQINAQVEQPEDVVLPSKILDHFIENSCHRVIMNFCICREAMPCEDYPLDYGCIFMGEGAKEIHPELGRVASVEETKAYAQRVREAGLIHKIGRVKGDAVWLDVKNHGKLLTVCNCCPCCCVARMVPYAPQAAKDVVSKVPGVAVSVTDECIGCGECMDDVCIFQAIEMDGDCAVITDDCKGCGRCVEVCPQEAIKISFNEDEYVQKAIEAISQRVDYQ